MPVQRVYQGQEQLDDLEVARQLGRRLWDEGDLQFDFGEIEGVTPGFAAELCRTIVERRSPAVLSNALLVHTMTPQVQTTFLPAIVAALGRGAREEPVPEVIGAVATADETERPPEPALNPFAVLKNVQSDYVTYVRTFQRFQNPQIREWVMDRIEHGTLLWKPPYVQLSRSFAQGESVEQLVKEGLLHPGVIRFGRRDPEDEVRYGRREAHRHRCGLNLEHLRSKGHETCSWQQLADQPQAFDAEHEWADQELPAEQYSHRRPRGANE